MTVNFTFSVNPCFLLLLFFVKFKWGKKKVVVVFVVVLCSRFESRKLKIQVPIPNPALLSTDCGRCRYWLLSEYFQGLLEILKPCKRMPSVL